MKVLRLAIVLAAHSLAVLLANAGIQGTLDLVDGPNCRAAGWSRDSSSAVPTEVRIYADGDIATGYLVLSTLADGPRPDLPFPDTDHAFDVNLPPDPRIVDGKTHTLAAYGVGGDGAAVRLARAGQAINCGLLASMVKDFGAEGDGIADDSDAIQRAIDATFRSGTVYIPAGTYMLGKPHGSPIVYSAEIAASTGVTGEGFALVLDRAIKLRGDGRNTILKLMPVRLGVILVRDSSDVVVERVVLDGNAAARYLRDPATGVSYDWPRGNIVSGVVSGTANSRGPRFRDCELRNSLEDGVGTLPGPGFTVESCYIHHNGAVAIDGSTRGGGVGISMNGGADNRALHNVIVSNTHGIAVGFGPRDHRIEGNAVIGNCNGMAIGSSPSTNDSDTPGVGFTIVDNLLERNGVCPGLGLYILGKESGLIADNVIVNNAGDGSAGLAFAPEPGTAYVSRNWSVLRNLIGNTAPDRPQRNGVVVDATSQAITLQDNAIFDNGERIDDQVIVRSASSINANWPSTNAVSFKAPGAVPPAPVVSSVTHAATGESGPLAPGEWIVITGHGLGPTTKVEGGVNRYGRLGKFVASVRVLFNRVPAPLISVSEGEIRAIVPFFTYWIDAAQVEVEYQGVRSNPLSVPVIESNPGVYTDGIRNADGQANSAATPAAVGSVVTMVATGLGQTDPVSIDGHVFGDRDLPRARGTIGAEVNGIVAEVVSATAAPFVAAGATRVVVKIPPTESNAVPLPLVLTANSHRSPLTALLFVAVGVSPEEVVEYYNADLDHYFITWVATEQANLDAGNTPTRWVRTGYAFKAYASSQAGTSPVCRYYIPPGKGDSHFFGRGAQECSETGQKNPTFVQESTDFMHLFLPAAGVCPTATTPVYRVFSNRADANHRYMTDSTVRDQMAAKGWTVEGDGPDAIVMCAPAT